MQTVSSHSNIPKAAIACANWKCGSGEGFKPFFESVGFHENHEKSQNMHQTCTRGTFVLGTKKGGIENSLSGECFKHIFQKWARDAHQRMKLRSGIVLGVRKCASGKHSVHISIFLHFHEIRICYVYSGQRNTSISCHQKTTVFVVSVFKNRFAAAIISGHCLRTPCENLKKMLPDMKFVFLHFSSEI